MGAMSLYFYFIFKEKVYLEQLVWGKRIITGKID
jgi:hypothetical protein